VTITATRTGGSLGGPVSVDYATSDGTATAGSDYAAATGRLTFGPGEASKSVTVHVTSDAAHEGDETFQVKLSNAAGGASLGSPAGATVTITDDDAAPAAPGASDSPAATPAPVMSDKTAPKLTLAAKRVQRALKAKRLALSARCDERCKLAVVAKLRIGKRTLALGRAKATVLTGKTVKVKVMLSRKALVKLRKATKRGKAKVVLSVRASDAAGNRAAGSRRVAVKR
jgi:Calx-beta domain